MRKAATTVVTGILVLSTLLTLFILNSSPTATGTPKSGTITADEIWNIVGSPYWIEGDFYVENGANLTIEAGVEVFVNDGFGLYINNGTLNASGTPSNIIKFTTNSTSPWPGNWTAIQVNSKGKAIIKYCDITYATYGIYLYQSSGNVVQNNDIYNVSQYGIWLWESSGNDIQNNSIFSKNFFWRGITLHSSSNNDILNNTIQDSWYGLHLSLSEYNNISYNRIHSNSGYGIYLRLLSHNNNITKNNISENSGHGFFMVDCSNNFIYHNIFWNNTNQAFDDSPNNFWDNGYPSGGNYWSDFNEPSEGAFDDYTGPNQNEPGGDGIVDNGTISGGGKNPYLNITGGAGAIDNYPLITPSISRIFVYLNSPINNSVVTPGIILDFIVVGDDIVLVNYSVNGSVNQTLPSPWDINGTETGGWWDGNHTIEIFAYDSKGNMTKYWFNITVDSILPVIILNAPPNGSLELPGVLINLTVLDDNLAIVNYTLDGGVVNTTIFDPYDIDTSPWSDGNRTIQVYAMDLAGNLNTTVYNFTLDGSSPLITITSPLNGSVVTPGTLLLFDIDDPHLNTSSVNYSINGQGPYTFTISYELNTTTWADDNYIIEINATDILDNARTSFFNITIDNIPPSISLISPMNDTIITAGTILDFEIFDDNLYEAKYYRNFDPPVDLLSPLFDVDTSLWEDGLYNISVNAIDRAGHSNWSYYFFTMATLPKIILMSPLNNSVIKAGEKIDLEIVDTNLDVVNTTYSINGEDKGTFGSPYDILTDTWGDGNYTVEIFAKDLAGNINSTWYNFTIDNIAPTIVLNAPSGNYVFAPGSILDFDVFDEHLLFVTNSTDGGPFISLPLPYDIPTFGWPDGDYSIQIRAVDEVWNENITEFIITIDSKAPIIQLLSPPNGSSSEIGVPINLSIIDDNLDYVKYSVNSGVNQTLTSPFSIDTSSFPDGNVAVVVYAFDKAGNSNTTSYDFFFFDITKPYITLISPGNQSYITVGTIIDLHISDINLRNVSYSLDGGNFIIFDFPYNITTSGWSEGMHTLTIYADDTRNNANTSSFMFTFDSEAPRILAFDPINNSAILPGRILDFIIIDDNLDYDSVIYSIKGMVFQTFPDPFNVNTTDWEDDTYDITIYAEDKAGNEITVWFGFIIDSIAPSILLNSPIEGTIISAGTLIDVTIFDENLDSAEYTINDGPVTMFYPAYDISTTGWLDNNYTIKIQAKDRAGNTRNVTYRFEVDSTPPEVTHISVAAPFYPYDYTNIIITFSEPMNKESVEAALNISPSLNYTISWYDGDKTLLLANLEGMEIFEFYSLNIDPNATDNAGNNLINFQGYGFNARIDETLDTDQDRMPDGWEIYYELDPDDPSDADEDKDEDGYSNLEEFEEGSDPTDPESVPLKPKEEATTLEYWWLIPVLIALLVMTILLFILLMGERKEEPKGPVEELEDMYLAMRAEKDIKAMESFVMDEERLGERLDEAKIMVQSAKEAFEKGDYNRVTVLEKTLRDLFGAEIEEGEMEDYENEEEISNEES